MWLDFYSSISIQMGRPLNTDLKMSFISSARLSWIGKCYIGLILDLFVRSNGGTLHRDFIAWLFGRWDDGWCHTERSVWTRPDSFKRYPAGDSKNRLFITNLCWGRSRAERRKSFPSRRKNKLSSFDKTDATAASSPAIDVSNHHTYTSPVVPQRSLICSAVVQPRAQSLNPIRLHAEQSLDVRWPQQSVFVWAMARIFIYQRGSDCS